MRKGLCPARSASPPPPSPWAGGARPVGEMRLRTQSLGHAGHARHLGTHGDGEGTPSVRPPEGTHPPFTVWPARPGFGLPPSFPLGPLARSAPAASLTSGAAGEDRVLGIVADRLGRPSPARSLASSPCGPSGSSGSDRSRPARPGRPDRIWPPGPGPQGLPVLSNPRGGCSGRAGRSVPATPVARAGPLGPLPGQGEGAVGSSPGPAQCCSLGPAARWPLAPGTRSLGLHLRSCPGVCRRLVACPSPGSPR